MPPSTGSIPLAAGPVKRMRALTVGRPRASTSQKGSAIGATRSGTGRGQNGVSEKAFQQAVIEFARLSGWLVRVVLWRPADWALIERELAR